MLRRRLCRSRSGPLAVGQNQSEGSNSRVRSSAAPIENSDARSRVSRRQRNLAISPPSSSRSVAPTSLSTMLPTVNGRIPKAFASSISRSVSSSPSGTKSRSRDAGGTSESPSAGVRLWVRAMTPRLRCPATPSVGSGIDTIRTPALPAETGTRTLSSSPRSSSSRASASSPSLTRSAANSSSRARKPISSSPGSHGPPAPGRHSSSIVSQSDWESSGCRETRKRLPDAPIPLAGTPRPVLLANVRGGERGAKLLDDVGVVVGEDLCRLPEVAVR